MKDQELPDFTNGAPTCSALSNLFSEVTAKPVCNFSCAHLILRAQHTLAGKEEWERLNSSLLKLCPLECLIPMLLTIEYIMCIS